MHEIPNTSPGGEAEAAIAAAIALLDRRALHSARLRHELSKAGFEQQDVQTAVQRMIELQLIDDRAMALRRIERMHEQGAVGPVKVRAQLRTDGYDDALIDAVLAESADGDPLAQALAYARRQQSTMLHLSAVQQQRRLVGRLQRRGFEEEVIARVMEQLAADGSA